jgi:hypothetical protein
MMIEKQNIFYKSKKLFSVSTTFSFPCKGHHKFKRHSAFCILHSAFHFRRFLLSLCIVHCALCISFAQENKISFWTPSPEYNKKRVQLLSWSLAGGYAISMTGLYQLWYKDYPLNKFHFFNDNNEWLQLDKSGHFISTYYIGKIGTGLFDWTGMSHKKAIWIGGSLGMAFMTTIEIFDGFSQQWGFSPGDMIANTSGYALLMSQQLLWDEQRITLKVSYHQSKFAQYRPDQFGTTFTEEMVKDYNGHTIWLSGNIHSFLKKESKFPQWLNIAGGYGVEGLTGATGNVSDYKGTPVPAFERQRQYYISPDIDLTKIKTKSKFLHSVFGAFGFIKFPAPAVEFNSTDKAKLHWIYF